MRTPEIEWRPLGEVLVSKRILTADELEDALAAQRRDGGLLGEIIVKNGLASRSQITTALGEQWGLELEPESGFGTGLRSELERRHAERRGNRPEEEDAAAAHEGTATSGRAGRVLGLLAGRVSGGLPHDEVSDGGDLAADHEPSAATSDEEHDRVEVLLGLVAERDAKIGELRDELAFVGNELALVRERLQEQETSGTTAQLAQAHDQVARLQHELDQALAAHEDHDRERDVLRSAMAERDRLLAELEPARADAADELERVRQELAGRPDPQYAAELEAALAAERARADELAERLALDRHTLELKLAEARAAAAAAADDERSELGQLREHVERLRAELEARPQATELAELQQRRDELERVRADLQAQLDVERGRADALVAAERARADELQNELGERERLLHESQSRHDDSAHELERLRAELAAAPAHAAGLADALAAEQSRARALEERLAAAGARYDELQSVAAGREEQGRQELTALRDRFAELDRAREDAVGELDRLRAELAQRPDREHLVQLDDALASERERAAALEQTLADERARAEQLDDDLRAERGRADELQQRLAAEEEERESQLAMLRAELERLREAGGEADGELARLRDELKQRPDRGRVNELEAALAAARARAETVEGVLTNERERATAREQALSDERARVEGLQAELAAGARRAEELQHSLAAAQVDGRELAGLQSELSELRRAREEEQRELGRLHAELQARPEAADVAALELALAAERARADGLVRELTEERVRGGRELERARDEADSAQQQRAALEDALAERERLLGQADAARAAAEDALERVSSELAGRPERAQVEALEAALAAERTRAGELADELERMRERLDEGVEQARAEGEQHERERAALRAELDGLRAVRDAEARRLEELRSELEGRPDPQRLAEVQTAFAAEHDRAERLETELEAVRRRADELSEALARAEQRGRDAENLERALEERERLLAELARFAAVEVVVVGEKAAADPAAAERPVSGAVATRDELAQLEDALEEERVRQRELAAELAALRAGLESVRTTSDDEAEPAPVADHRPTEYLLRLPGAGDGELLVATGDPPAAGRRIELLQGNGERRRFVAERVGPSPLEGDRRRCVYLTLAA